MNETIKINGVEFCASCYAEASKDTKGKDEELGFLAYNFLHYEWAHLTPEQQQALIA